MGSATASLEAPWRRSNLTLSLHETLSERKMLQSFLAGSLSGSMSTILFQPFDLVKTRLQYNSCCSKVSSSGMTQILVSIFRQQSVPGLWQGTSAALVRTVPGVGLYFTTLDILRSNFSSKSTSKSRSALESLVFGAVARAFAGFVLLPATVLKTRYESGLFNYTSLSHALNSTYSTGGIRLLYSGTAATLLRDVPYSGLYFMFYTLIKDHSPLNESRSSSPVIFLCGLSAGILASAITHPFDVVKTKMQLHSYQNIRSTNQGFVTCVKLIYEQKGIRGFSAGITPRILRRSLMSGLSWTVFEKFSSYIKSSN